MILVTGATGRTGSEVVKALIAKGEQVQQVRALVRDPERAEAIQGPGVELVVGDVEKPCPLPANY